MIIRHPLSPMNPPAIKGLPVMFVAFVTPKRDVIITINPTAKIVCEHQLNHLKSTINPIQSLVFLDKSPCFLWFFLWFSYG